MIRKLAIFALPVLALVGGTLAGDMLGRPAATAADTPLPSDQATAEPAADGQAGPPAAEDDQGGGVASEAGWFTFPTQFFVPLARQGDMRDMMILTLTLQTDTASVDALGRKEHALRDALLRALMIHANTGGFDGNYTADRNLTLLRASLLKAGQAVTDLPLNAVLIEDIALQPG